MSYCNDTQSLKIVAVFLIRRDKLTLQQVPDGFVCFFSLTYLDIINPFAHSIHHEEGIVQVLLGPPSKQSRKRKSNRTHLQMCCRGFYKSEQQNGAIRVFLGPLNVSAAGSI